MSSNAKSNKNQPPKAGKRQGRSQSKQSRRTGRRRTTRWESELARAGPIPMAAGTILRSKAPTTTSRGRNVIRVSGRDLVQATSLSLPRAGGAGPFAIVPANPFFWSGTRVSAICKGYQYYRPLSFTVYYIPQVPVTNPGNVIMGTLWQTDALANATQQLLLTSNGGVMCQCYVSAVSKVKCGESLPQKQFTINGDSVDQQCCPFYWLAMYTGATDDSSSVPGFVLVDWLYEFINPSGNLSTTAETVTQAPEEAVARYMRYHRLRANPLPSFLWGIPIGILKTFGRPILEKVGCMLLDGAKSVVNKLTYGVGKMLAWTHDNTTQNVRNDENTEVVDPQSGERDVIPDDTRVAVFMSGKPVGDQDVGPARLQHLDITNMIFMYGTNGSYSQEYTLSVSGMVLDKTQHALRVTDPRAPNWVLAIKLHPGSPSKTESTAFLENTTNAVLAYTCVAHYTDGTSKDFVNFMPIPFTTGFYYINDPISWSADNSLYQEEPEVYTYKSQAIPEASVALAIR